MDKFIIAELKKRQELQSLENAFIYAGMKIQKRKDKLNNAIKTEYEEIACGILDK